MKVISMKYPTSLKECHQDDNIDVFVTLENQRTYCMTVTTIKWLENYMKETHKKYLEPGTIDLIVEKIDSQIIEETIKEYAKDDAYWLKVLSLSYGDQMIE